MSLSRYAKAKKPASETVLAHVCRDVFQCLSRDDLDTTQLCCRLFFHRIEGLVGGPLRAFDNGTVLASKRRRPLVEVEVDCEHRYLWREFDGNPDETAAYLRNCVVTRLRVVNVATALTVFRELRKLGQKLKVQGMLTIDNACFSGVFLRSFVLHDALEELIGSFSSVRRLQMMSDSPLHSNFNFFGNSIPLCDRFVASCIERGVRSLGMTLRSSVTEKAILSFLFRDDGSDLPLTLCLQAPRVSINIIPKLIEMASKRRHDVSKLTLSLRGLWADSRNLRGFEELIQTNTPPATFHHGMPAYPVPHNYMNRDGLSIAIQVYGSGGPRSILSVEIRRTE